MKRLILSMMPWLIASAVLAGCGSSNRTTSPRSGGSATSTSTPSSGGGRAYGAYGPASSSSSTTSAASSSAPSAAVISTKPSKLGTILAAGSRQLSVYLFAADKGTASSCNGACASAWPPVTTSAAPTTHGQAMSADLGTITRSDGKRQVTYKGHPLYYFTRDKSARDINGQGVNAFGAPWYVLAPSGQKIDNS